MNRLHVLTATLLLAAAGIAAAAASRPHPFDPPGAAALGLDGAAAQQWTALREETIALRSTMRDAATRKLAALQDLLATAAPDLDAFNRDAETETDALLMRARALNARKLAFYDSQPAAQQARMRAVMRTRVERLQHLRSALSELAQAAP